jgi:hypothetical protein
VPQYAGLGCHPAARAGHTIRSGTSSRRTLGSVRRIPQVSESRCDSAELLSGMTASAVRLDGTPLAPKGLHVRLTASRIEVLRFKKLWSLRLEEISSVTGLRGGRFTVVTHEGASWEFVQHETAVSGMYTPTLGVIRANAAHFYSSLQSALGHTCSFGAWPQTKLDRSHGTRSECQGSSPQMLVKTHAVAVVDGLPAGMALCGARVVGELVGTFTEDVERRCRPCAVIRWDRATADKTAP